MIEVMSAVLVLSVLAAMSVISFRKSINQQKLTGETNSAASTLKYIGAEARVSKTKIRVRVDFDKNIIIGWVDSNKNNLYDTSERVIARFDSPSGVDIYTGFINTKKTTGYAYFNFLPDGKASLEATLVMRGTATGIMKTITVNPQSGWVEVFEGAPSGLATGGSSA